MRYRSKIISLKIKTFRIGFRCEKKIRRKTLHFTSKYLYLSTIYTGFEIIIFITRENFKKFGKYEICIYSTYI